MCGDLVNLLQVLQNLLRGGANLLGKVCLLLGAQLAVPPQELSVENGPLRTVQELAPAVELPV